MTCVNIVGGGGSYLSLQRSTESAANGTSFDDNQKHIQQQQETLQTTADVS